MLKNLALLIFAILSQNAQINAMVGLPLDAKTATNGAHLPPVDAESVLNQSPLAQVASQLIQTSCLLVSPTDAERIQMCVGTLTDKLQLPAIVSAKQVSPLALACLLNVDQVRDIEELSTLKNADLGLVSNLLSELLSLLQNPLQNQDHLKALRKEAVLNIVQSSGLSPEKIASILTENSVLTGHLPGLGGLPGVPGLNGLPVAMPGVPGLNGLPVGIPGVPGFVPVPRLSDLSARFPDVPGLSGLPAGLPGVPGLNGLPVAMPGVPGLNGLPVAMPGVPGLNGLQVAMPGVPGLSGLPAGLPGVPGLSGLPVAMPAVPGLSGLPVGMPGVPGLNVLSGIPVVSGQAKQHGLY